MRMRTSTFLSAIVLCLFNSVSMGQNLEQHTKVANQLKDLINSSDYPAVQKLFNREMDKALPSAKAKAFFQSLNEQAGKLIKLGQPRAASGWVVFPAKFERLDFDLKIAVDGNNQIAGLLITPPTPIKAAPEKHQTELSLPFKGRWLVFWGGDTKAQNYHRDVPNQRFAFDLVGADENGKTRRGRNNKNEDYFAFGREVLAPADGKIIEMIDGVRDNEPGSMNPFSAVGNCVMIQHREDEVSVLAHFKQDSIRVKAGDAVKRGQVLGLCGNSGNSSEPHLHYHLQHSPVTQDGLGIKCVFHQMVVVKDGNTETKKNYSPVKGEIISPE